LPTRKRRPFLIDRPGEQHQGPHVAVPPRDANGLRDAAAAAADPHARAIHAWL
jgi:hypothetical protein